MSMPGWLTKIRAPLQEFGFWPGLVYGVDRALGLISPRLRLIAYHLMVQPIPEQPILPERFARGFAIRQIQVGDRELNAMPARPDIIAARLDQGAICLGAFRNDTMVAYMWFCFDGYVEDEVRCYYALAPGRHTVFDFDFYIYPEHRSGFTFAALWNGANRFLRERQVRETFSRVSIANVASLRAHTKLGARSIGRVFFLRLWRLEVMLGSVRPYVSLTLRSDATVRLRMQTNG